MADAPVTIQIDGIDRVLRKLGKVEGQKVLRVPVEQSVAVLQADMKEYPPVRTMSLVTRAAKAGRRKGAIKAVGIIKGNKRQAYWVSSYRRTGTLGRRWTKKVRNTGDGVVGVVGNNTKYAPWVQSSRFQAWMHQGRWQTDKDVMERNRRQILDFFRAAIRRALGG